MYLQTFRYTKIRNASKNNIQHETVRKNTIIGKMTFNNIDYKYAF